jgi:hypothetical protein
MNKPLALSAGVGLLSILGGLYYSANMVKMDSQQAQPDMSAAYKAQNELNITSLSTARSQYLLEKGKQPDSLQDLTPRFIDKIANEAFSKSNQSVKVYDGSGGWVLTDDAILPNFPQELSPVAAAP